MRSWFAKLKTALGRSAPVRTTQSVSVKDAIDLTLEALRNQNASLRGLLRQQRAVEHRLSAIEAKIQQAERRVQQAEQRVEFVRRETLFELTTTQRSGSEGIDGTQPSTGERGHSKPRIVDHGKIDGAKGALRLNLGCGHVALPEYVNVDLRELPGVDVIAAAGDLPFGPGSVSEIFSSHMLEHFPLEKLRRVLLPYWVSRLTPGGSFRAIVPDADAMMRAYVAGEMNFADITEVTFGTQEYIGDQHYTMFSQDSVERLLHQAGLTNFEMITAGRRNGLCLEMEFAAIKPTADAV